MVTVSWAVTQPMTTGGPSRAAASLLRAARLRPGGSRARRRRALAIPPLGLPGRVVTHVLVPDETLVRLPNGTAVVGTALGATLTGLTLAARRVEPELCVRSDRCTSHVASQTDSHHTQWRSPRWDVIAGWSFT